MKGTTRLPKGLHSKPHEMAQPEHEDDRGGMQDPPAGFP
jgi:hypothetical protein